MKKLVCIVVFVYMLQLFPMFLNSCDECVEAAVKELDNGGITYLLCGLDDAAENTDSILLMNYSFALNSAHFIQIPRDTYFEYKGYSRINSIYPLLRSEGMNRDEAMETFRGLLSNALGIEIDAYVAYTTDAFANIIDAIGGVTLDLPCDMFIKDSSGSVILKLHRGMNKINGSDSINFLRSRNSYLMGDIGRLDAQKMFISALLKEVKHNLGINDILNLCSTRFDGWVISCKIGDFLKIAAKNGGRIANISTRYLNIPGAVCRDKTGSWRYSVCAYDCREMFSSLGFRVVDSFDKKRILESEEADFSKIYNGKNYSSKIYDDDSLRDLEIKMK